VGLESFPACTFPVQRLNAKIQTSGRKRLRCVARVPAAGIQKEFSIRMKRVSVLAVVLASGFALSAAAQTSAASAAAGAPKVAVIAFQAAVTATNEFQRDFGDLQKKFEPQRNQLKGLSDEMDALTKQLQSQSATLSDADRAAKAKTIDDKKKQAQRLAEDAQNDYQTAMQETFGKVAQKVDGVLNTYAKEQGYTVVIDATENQQQAPLVLYAAPSSDITKVIVDAYNAKSGVPAPPVEAPAPAAARPAAKAPAAK
jgi:outer membrane protein